MARKRRGRGEGRIFQRADRQWVATVSLGYDGNGKRRRRTVYGGTKKEVQDKLAELKAGAAACTLTDAGQLTTGAYLDRWLATVKAKISPGTYQRYEQHVRLHLKEHLGQIRLVKLTALHIEQLLATMAEAEASAAEQQKTGKCLRQALRHAVNIGLIPSSPAGRVPLPRVAKVGIHPLDADQVQRFLATTAGDRLHALYVLALDSGMRQGEVFALQWPDVGFGNGCVHVRRSLEELNGQCRIKDVKTAKGRRRIDLSAFTLAVLNEHRQAMLKEGRASNDTPIFCDTEGGWLRKSNVHRGRFTPS